MIAQDGQGRVLFLVAPLGYFTLYQLSQWLVNSDLDVQIALNLLEGAAVITRASQLRSFGLPVPTTAFQFQPRPLS